VRGVRSVETVGQHIVGRLVVNQLAGSECRADTLGQRVCAALHGAEQIAGGNVRNSIFLADRRRLRAFTTALHAHN
jgi:hypothetical protein